MRNVEVGDLATWAAAAVAIIALGVSIWAVIEARKSRKAAHRSAVAAEEAAEAAKRSANADEASYQLARRQYEESRPPAVSWDIQPMDKNRYRLVNVGTEKATGVTVDPVLIEAPHRQLPRDATVIGNGGYVEFFILRVMQAPLPTHLTASWDGAQNPVEVPLRTL